MKRRRKSSRRRHKISHRRHAYNRGRKHSRRSRRNRGGGKYSSFVKKHKGLFKKMGFRAASKKIGSMWRSKH